MPLALALTSHRAWARDPIAEVEQVQSPKLPNSTNETARQVYAKHESPTFHIFVSSTETY